MNRTETPFAACIRNKDYPASLELRKLYCVISDAEAAKRHQIQVVDESGENYVYPAQNFVPITLPRGRRTGCPPGSLVDFRQMLCLI